MSLAMFIGEDLVMIELAGGNCDLRNCMRVCDAF